jgi:hypothetical protein
MLYTALDMAATRTQIYLTLEQRTRLDALGEQEGKGLAELIREAVDRYLAERPDPAAALEQTFGSLPDLAVPDRREWERA